jgi:hypothetical protein
VGRTIRSVRSWGFHFGENLRKEKIEPQERVQNLGALFSVP